MSEKISEVIEAAEDLKARIWALIEEKNKPTTKLTCKGVKDTMNELLDLLDNIADERVWE